MIFDALTEHGDVNINGAREGGAMPPNIMQQGGAAESDTTMFNQLAQQEEFLGRDRNVAAILKEAAAKEVHVNVSELEDSGGSSGPAPHCLDASIYFTRIDRFDEDLVGGRFEQGDLFVQRGRSGDYEQRQFWAESMNLAAQLDRGAIGAGDTNENGIGGGEELRLDAGALEGKHIGRCRFHADKHGTVGRAGTFPGQCEGLRS